MISLQQIVTGFSIVFIVAMLLHEMGDDEKGSSKGGGGGPGFMNLFMLLLMPVFAIGGLLLLLGKAIFKAFPFLLRLLDLAFQGVKKILSYLGRFIVKTMHALFTLAKNALSAAWKFLKGFFRSLNNFSQFLGKILSALRAAGRFITKTLHALFTLAKNLVASAWRLLKTLVRGLLKIGRSLLGIFPFLRTIGRWIMKGLRVIGRLLKRLGRFILRHIPSFILDALFLIFWFLKRRGGDETADDADRIDALEQRVADLMKKEKEKEKEGNSTVSRPGMFAKMKKTWKSASNELQRIKKRESEDGTEGNAKASREGMFAKMKQALQSTSKESNHTKESASNAVFGDGVKKSGMALEKESKSTSKNILPTLQRIGWYTRRRISARV